jgi:hypothetical protein
MKTRLAVTLVIVGLAAALLMAGCGEADQEPEEPRSPLSPTADALPGAPSVSLQRVPGSYSQPLYVTSPAGDSRLFIVEKTGAVRIVKDGAVVEAPFLDLSDTVSNGREQGLLCLAFDPDYAENRTFYVNYTDRDGTTKVDSYRASGEDPDRAEPGSRNELLSISQPYSNHNGGQLQFGPDGHLYVGTGDGGGAGDPEGRAQDMDSRLGKILRLTVKGPETTVQVYALGLRNPWRFSFDRETDDLWIGDVGQNSREEINHLPADSPPGSNFGWNGYEGSEVYDETTAARLDRDELVFPIAEYGHQTGRSVTGGYVYRGQALPDLQGFYVFGDFVTGRIWAMRGDDDSMAPLSGADRRIGTISSFGEDADGELYVVSLEGTVHRLAQAD